jgi:hypothetical protein
MWSEKIMYVNKAIFLIVYTPCFWAKIETNETAFITGTYKKTGNYFFPYSATYCTPFSFIKLADFIVLYFLRLSLF